MLLCLLLVFLLLYGLALLPWKRRCNAFETLDEVLLKLADNLDELAAGQLQFIAHEDIVRDSYEDELDLLC